MEAWISLVIPLAPGEDSWRTLLPLVVERPEIAAIILSIPSGSEPAELQTWCDVWPHKLRLIEGSKGRAAQINRAIEMAETSWIWVLHADSTFSESIWPHLERARHASQTLYYCDLSFRSRKLRMKLNSWGARARSQLFGMPFGDQGFLFVKEIWAELGRFPEDAPYGEDHLFVWRWRQADRSLRRIPVPIITSPRKYESRGWCTTTCQHVYLTWKQAIPEILKIYRFKWRKAFGEASPGACWDAAKPQSMSKEKEIL